MEAFSPAAAREGSTGARDWPAGQQRYKRELSPGSPFSTYRGLPLKLCASCQL